MEGESGGVKWSAPHRHTTPQHNNNDTPHNTTGDPAQGGLGQRGSLEGRSMAQKTRHEQQIVPKSNPIGPSFSGSRMVRKGLGTKRFDSKKEPEAAWAKSGVGKSGAGQKRSEKPKNMEKQIKKTLSFSKTKNKMKKEKQKNTKSTKNEKKKNSLFTPPRVKN